MRTQVAIVAWLHIVLSGLTLVVGGALFFASVVLGLFSVHSLPIVGGLGFLVFIFFLLFSLPGLLVGWGLLNFAPWARVVGIVLSILSLLHPAVGIGTAIGIYSLYVLFHPETVALFEGRYSAYRS
ncbi:MAG: hypothetical protein LC772_02725 [Chloroflexi bacterium]|nr:hypothetical protein [Chloroflexota bacterium]